MGHYEEFVVESSSFLRQVQRRLEGARDRALLREIVLTCTDPVPGVDEVTDSDERLLVLRSPGASALLPGVKDALAFALAELDVEHLSVLGHSGCRYALHQCDEAGEGGAVVLPRDSIARLRERVAYKERLLDASRRNVRAQVRALLAWQPVRSRVDEGRLRVRGAVYLTESGVLSRYREDTDEFVADLRDVA